MTLVVLRPAAELGPTRADSLRHADLPGTQPVSQVSQRSRNPRSRIGRGIGLRPYPVHVEYAHLAIEERFDAADQPLAAEDR